MVAVVGSFVCCSVVILFACCCVVLLDDRDLQGCQCCVVWCIEIIATLIDAVLVCVVVGLLWCCG